jgi:uncharacterized FlaG/YvyC family protein
VEITRANFVQMLRDLKSENGKPHALIISFTTETEPKMLKKHPDTKVRNPFLKITKKFSYIVGIINFRYSRAVNNQRVREADPETEEAFQQIPHFRALPRHWGTHVPASPLIEHTNEQNEYKLYLEIMITKRVEDTYTINDKPPTPEQMAQLEEYFPSTEKEGQRQEVEKIVKLRTYDVNNICSFNLNQTEYRITK